MRALLCSVLALGGCSQILGIEDFEISEPGIEGRLGVRLSDGPQDESTIRLLDGVPVDWENPVGTSVSQGSVVGGYYNIPMDRLSGSDREGGSLHFDVMEQMLDVYVHLRRQVEFGQTIDVVIPAGPLRRGDGMIAAVVRDQFGNPVSDVTVELQDENDTMVAAEFVYLDDDQVPDMNRGTTGGFGLVWFYGTEVSAGRQYQVYAQSGQTQFTSRVITMTPDSLHFLAAEEE